jgi:hypothetical protein
LLKPPKQQSDVRGNYTAVARRTNNITGVTLVEVYILDAS